MRTIMLSLAYMLVFQLTLIATSNGAEKGIVGYWNFDEGSGKIAKDSSKFGNKGSRKFMENWLAMRSG